MSRTIDLPNGQRFVVISLIEAASILDCSTTELANWIANGMINNIQCPTCHFTYPLQSDIKSLAGYADDFPTSVTMDEIVNERQNEMLQAKNRRPGLAGLFKQQARRPEPEPVRTHKKAGAMLTHRARR